LQPGLLLRIAELGEWPVSGSVKPKPNFASVSQVLIRGTAATDHDPS